MPLTKVTRRYQVTIPASLRQALGIEIGDIMEVTQEKNRIVMIPKTLVDKQIEERLAEGLEDIKKGRVLGPFKTAKEAMRALRGRTR